MKPFIHRFFTVLLILIITVTIIIYYAVKIEPYTVTINNVNLNNNFPENLDRKSTRLNSSHRL